MNEEVWKQNAISNNGYLSFWIGQGTDPKIKAANSNGVCFAMSFDFVTSFQRGNPLSAEFVNGVRNASKIWPYTSRIPSKYLEIQAASQEMLDQYTQNLKNIYNQYKDEIEPTGWQNWTSWKSWRNWIMGENEGKKIINELMINRIKQRYGPGMYSILKFTDQSLLAPDVIMQKINEEVTNNGPGYFLVGMRGNKGGHAVAFGIRRDIANGIYYLLDANLGFFGFHSLDGISNFFTIDMWASIYGETDYSKFEIAYYPVASGHY